MAKRFLSLLCCVTATWACSSMLTTPDPLFPNETNLFYPTIGQFVVYDVTQTQYSLITNPIVSSFQLKEVVKSVFQDAQGQQALRIERYKRANDSQTWTIDSVFVAKRQPDKALKTESNQTYVKLVFPIRENLRWDGNALNALGKDEYDLKKVNQVYQVGAKSYPNTVTVVQQQDSTLVSQDKRIEVFAVNIGLIYKEKTNLFFCNAPNCLGKAQIDFGSKIIMRINSVGQEP